jgi:hypothetical protein
MAATGKPPMVELVTINKHYREITRTVKKTKKLYAKPIKITNMFSSQYEPSGIFVANYFQVGIERTRDIRCTPTAHLVLPVDGTHLEIPTSHTWLLVS